MSDFSTPAHFIRVHVFGVHTQWEFAAKLKVSQATISRLETGEAELARSEVVPRVRALAKKERRPWDDSWIFEVPKAVKLSRERSVA